MIATLRGAISLLLMILMLGLASCGGDRNAPTVLLAGNETTSTTNPLIGVLAEVSPPASIQQLKPFMDVYEPQVRIASPKDSSILKDTTVSVELQVRDFPIYKDADLGLGPHLHLLLDDQPYQPVYDADVPITFTDVSPGTHTLRVFATRPWDESFKNDGAYDQVTFSILTESPHNNPDNNQILLTYGQPQGIYGVEPIMLDFYLTNAPLHMVSETDETIIDWRIRCTVNGESFVFDRWQPIYLKGFQPGKNWVKLEIIDSNGDLVDNAFNTGIRLIEYIPGATDDLSKLIRGEIPLSKARVLVDPNYVPPAPVVEEEPPLQEEVLDADEENTPELPPAEVQSEPGVVEENESDLLETEETGREIETEAAPLESPAPEKVLSEPSDNETENHLDSDSVPLLLEDAEEVPTSESKEVSNAEEIAQPDLSGREARESQADDTPDFQESSLDDVSPIEPQTLPQETEEAEGELLELSTEEEHSPEVDNSINTPSSDLNVQDLDIKSNPTFPTTIEFLNGADVI
ncbi:MAG: hypothetical protein F6K42_14050 [Leptolyngbya sp. SIO1D8]|nr:hypothetical protein [Leptolyngbya sp. SIO1D8]